MMACCSAALDPREQTAQGVDLRSAERGLRRMQLINGETYQAALALPNFVRALLA